MTEAKDIHPTRSDGKFTIVLIQIGSRNHTISWAADTLVECFAWSAKYDEWRIAGIVDHRLACLDMIQQKEPVQ